ncbi:MAG: hypothetical protein F9K18_01595 [Thermoanaerobaculia bacterium]|nr:MAG: hypothetical protein F9K18_01595 [Thermoanaerobaculia bacterium]
MKLEEALLCVECECVYSCSSQCPQCGSRVAYPISRALNRLAASAGVLAIRPPPREALAGPRPAAAWRRRTLNLLQRA